MITFPSVKHEILLPKYPARNKCLYGGRGGAKSWSAALAAIAIADKCKCRIFCTREVQVSIADSMYRLIKDLIRDNGLEKRFQIYENEGIIGLRHGSEFIFKGMHNCKSVEGIDIAIVEEAQQVSKKNADLLEPTVRKPGSQIWWLWNPENEDDWVHDHFAINTQPDTIIQKVNYFDNPYCSEEIIKLANNLKNTDYEEYRHIYLGELKPKNKDWSFINPLWLDHAASGDVKPLSQILMSRYAIGSDPALQGEDCWVTITGKGNRVLEIYAVKYSDSETIAANLNSRVLAAGRFNCDLGVDGVGTGIGVCDILEKRYGLGDCLNRCSRKDRDFVPPPPRGTDCPALDQFDCWKSQAWFLLKHDLEMGNIDLSEAAAKQPEEFKLLKKELIAHNMTVDKAGKMRVKPKAEVKKELGRSPDRADALVAWNWVRKREEDFMPSRRDGNRETIASWLF